MSTKRKVVLVIMIIILTGRLLGEIKAAGKLLIPTSEGKEKSYRGVITITRAEILIECQAKIFQPLNDFEAPKKSCLKINTADVLRMSLLKNGVVIFPKTPLYNRYRNILIHISIHSIMNEQEKLVFLFAFDIEDIHKTFGSNEEKLIDLINKRNDPRCTLCGFIIFY